MTYKIEKTFIHIADIHLGMKVEEELYPRCDRECEIKERFWEILEICQQEKIAFLLICGDLFHNIPSKRLLEEVDRRFASLLYTQVIMVMGNHDCLSKTNPLTYHQWSQNVHLLKSEEGEVIQLGGIYFYGASYHQAQYTKDIYWQIRPKDKAGTHILLAHGGDSLHSPFTISGMEKKGFDYVALGHIHSPYLGIRVAYPGSLTPLHRLELGERGYVQGKILKNGAISFEWKALDGRQYYEISIKADKEESYTSLEKKIRKEICMKGSKNLFIITLMGEVGEVIQNRLDLLKRIGLIVDIRIQSIKRLHQGKESSKWVDEVLEKKLAKLLEDDEKKDSILNRIRKAIYQR